MSEHDEGAEGPARPSPWARPGPSSPPPWGAPDPAGAGEPGAAEPGAEPTAPQHVTAPAGDTGELPTTTPAADGADDAAAFAVPVGPAASPGHAAPPPPSWAAATPPSGAWGAPPVSPAPAGGRGGGGLRQVLLGALVGALVASGVSAAVYVGADNDRSGNPSPTVAAARNTSAFPSPNDVHAVLEKVEPAVVAITTGSAAGDNLFGQSPGSGGGAGTGIVISSDGYIVTNNHVINGAGTRIEVTFNDGTHKRATLVGQDPSADLAVLKTDATGLTAAVLGDSDKLVVGDEVIAIGNALALPGQPSVTRGIVSALNRSIDTQINTTLDHMIQTDAAINPGNSGGPLVNSAGQVVGINTAIADPSQAQNVGFAIAVNQAKPIVDELRAGKIIQPAFLGVVTQTVTPAIANQLNLKVTTGAVVQRVEPNSPADNGGVQQGDVIVKVADTQVKQAQDVGNAVRGHRPGDKITLVVNRGGTTKSIDVTLAARPENLG